MRAARTAGTTPTRSTAASSSMAAPVRDRKSTRLNSSHLVISYAVFCLIPPPPRPSLFTYTTLFRSLTEITGQVASCVFPFESAPPDADNIAVKLDGKKLSRDASRADGWDYTDAEHRGIELYGSACERSEEHTSELQSPCNLVCRLLLDPAPPSSLPLYLHDALPISHRDHGTGCQLRVPVRERAAGCRQHRREARRQEAEPRCEPRGRLGLHRRGAPRHRALWQRL